MVFSIKAALFKINILVFILITFACAFPMYAQDTVPDTLVISIGRIHNQLQGKWGELSISIDSSSSMINQIESFEFLIGYETHALTMVKVLPGSLIDSGKFEYFSSRPGPFEGCDSTCPSAMMKISGKRDVENGVENKYKIDTPGYLIRLKYLFTSNYNYTCKYVPVRFYWLSCEDNNLTDEADKPICSKTEVLDYSNCKIIANNNHKYIKPLTGCNDMVTQKDTRLILRNGFIHAICNVLDARGDVNLNGCSGEIEDIRMFIDYFLYGVSMFKINYFGQSAATDVNGDGKQLTIRDLIYMIRDFEHRIDHRHCPFPTSEKTINGHLYFIDTDSSIIIKTNSEDSLGGMYMTFYTPDLKSEDEYQIITSTDLQNMDVSHNLQNDTLKMLIFQFSNDQKSATIKKGPNDILEIIYSGARPRLIHASAAGFLAEPVSLKIF